MRRTYLLILLISGLCNAAVLRPAIAAEVVTSPSSTQETPPLNVPVGPGIDTHATGTVVPIELPQLPPPLPEPVQQTSTTPVAEKQEGPAKGLYIGFFLPYTSIRHDRHGTADYAYLNTLDNGAGFGIRPGYSFTDLIAIEWSIFTTWHNTDQRTLTGSSVQDQALNGTALSVKFRAPLPESGVVPYLQGGMGYAWLGDDLGTSDAHYRGRELQAGFGIEYRLPEQIRVSAGMTGRKIVFNSGKWIGSETAAVKAITVDIGIAYHFE